MAQQEGPFSEYLQQLKITPQVQAPQPTGLEGTGSAIGNIAMNFISGLRQGRQQKYMQQQMEEQRKFDAYQQAMQRVASSDLTDNEKRGLYAELEAPLIRRIAGDPEATSKKTGNPLTDVIKNIASSVAGPVPKKGMELTMDPVLKALQAVSDPNRSKTRLASQYEGRIRSRLGQLIKDNPYMQSGDILKDPGISAIRQEAEQSLGGAFASPALSEALQEFRSVSPSDQLKMQVMQQYFGQGGARASSGATAAGTGIPPVAPAPVMAGAQPPVPAKEESSPARVGIPLSQAEINQAATAAQVTGIPLYRESQTTEEFETPGGKRLTGKNITVNYPGRGVMSGIYDPDTQTLYPLPSLKRLKPGQGTSLEVKEAVDSATKSVDQLLKGEDPRVIAAFRSEINQAINQGDLPVIKGINARVSKYITDKLDKDRADIAAEQRQVRGNARREAEAEDKLNIKKQDALVKAHTMYLNSKAHDTFRKMDSQYNAFLSEDKGQGINVDAYIADPAGYMSKIPENQRQNHLSLMDKSLQRLAAKITDDGSVVRPLEEEGYGADISGPAANLRATLNAFLGTGSTKSTPGARIELWKLIKGFYGQLKRIDDREKQDRIQSISGWQIDPEKIQQTFYGSTPKDGSAPKERKYTPPPTSPVTPPGSLSQIPGAKKRSQ